MSLPAAAAAASASNLNSKCFSAVRPIAGRRYPSDATRKRSAWDAFVRVTRGTIASKKGAADSHNSKRICKAAFGSLKAHLAIQRRVSFRASVMGEKIKRRDRARGVSGAFRAWASVPAEKNYSADAHRALRSTREMLSAWRSRAKSSSRRVGVGRRIQSARKQREAWNTLAAWRRAAAASSKRNELRMVSAAIEHRDASVATAAFASWGAFCKGAAEKRARMEMAALHFRQEGLREACGALRRHAIERRKERFNTLLTIRFRYRVIVGGAFSWWAKAAEKRLAALHRRKRAETFCAARTLRSHFLAWIQRTRSKIRRRDAVAFANASRASRMRVECFRSWRFAAELRKSKRALVECAKDYFSANAKKAALAAWKQRTAKRRDWSQACERAEAHRARTLLHKTFTHRWLPFASACADMKRKNTLAADHYNARAGAQTFRAWSEWALGRKLKQFERERRIHAASQRLIVSKRDRAMRAWIEWYRSRCVRRYQTRCAKEHFERGLERRTLRAWRIWASDHHAKSILWGLALRADDYRLARTAFGAWRRYVCASQLRVRNTVLALRHWAKGLKLRSFRAFAFNRKDAARKRRRSELAVDWRRRHLLKSGVAWWINAAMAYESYADDLAVRAVASKSVNLMRRVKKYARHWRAVVARRRWNRAMRTAPGSFTGVALSPQRRGVSFVPSLPYDTRTSKSTAISLPRRESSLLDARRCLQPSLSLDWIDDLVPSKVQRPAPRCPADIFRELSSNAAPQPAMLGPVRPSRPPPPAPPSGQENTPAISALSKFPRERGARFKAWLGRLNALLQTPLKIGTPKLASLLREIAALEKQVDAFHVALPHIVDENERDDMQARVDAYAAFKDRVAPKLRRLETEIQKRRKQRAR